MGGAGARRRRGIPSELGECTQGRGGTEDSFGIETGRATDTILATKRIVITFSGKLLPVKNRPLITLISVFFFWGFVAASNTVLIGLFKKNFELTQFQSQLVDLAFYAAYFIGSLLYFFISYAAGDPLNKIGYKKGLILGLVISAIGALGFIPAEMAQSFPLMLTSLFTIGLGFALQQIVANPYVIALGPPETGAHRNSLAGGINSFGTTIGPLLLAVAVYGSISGSSAFVKTEHEAQLTGISLNVDRTTGKSENLSMPVAFFSDTMQLSQLPANAYIVAPAESRIESAYQLLVDRKSGGLIVLNEKYYKTKAIQKLKEHFPEERIPVLSGEPETISRLGALTSGQKVFVEVRYYGVDTVVMPSIILAGAFLFFALILGFSNLPPISSTEKISRDLGALRYPQIWLGMIAIFIYVGTEVTIQSNLPEYMRKMFSREPGTTVHFISLYWGSLMIGRWVGALTVFNLKGFSKTIMTVIAPLIAYAVILMVNYIKGSPMDELLKYLPFIGIIICGFFMAAEKPARTMILFGIMAAIMMTLGLVLKNEWSTYCFVSGGLFCSVMWPCIFSLSIAGLGKYTTQGSSLLIMMILGGAIIPPLQGLISDSTGIHFSYIVPLAGFLYLAFFGWKVRKTLSSQGIDYDKSVEAH
jgi:MFS transporter, FHS family, L-fucose permease